MAWHGMAWHGRHDAGFIAPLYKSGIRGLKGHDALHEIPIRRASPR